MTFTLQSTPSVTALWRWSRYLGCRLLKRTDDSENPNLGIFSDWSQSKDRMVDESLGNTACWDISLPHWKCLSLFQSGDKQRDTFTVLECWDTSAIYNQLAVQWQTFQRGQISVTCCRFSASGSRPQQEVMGWPWEVHSQRIWQNVSCPWQQILNL